MRIVAEYKGVREFMQPLLDREFMLDVSVLNDSCVRLG